MAHPVVPLVCMICDRASAVCPDGYVHRHCCNKCRRSEGVDHARKCDRAAGVPRAAWRGPYSTSRTPQAGGSGTPPPIMWVHDEPEAETAAGAAPPPLAAVSSAEARATTPPRTERVWCVYGETPAGMVELVAKMRTETEAQTAVQSLQQAWRVLNLMRDIWCECVVIRLHR